MNKNQDQDNKSSDEQHSTKSKGAGFVLSEKKKMFLFEFIDTVIEVVILLIVFLSIQYFIVSPFIVSGSSMEASLFDQELILVNRIEYGNHNGIKLGAPHAGDVIVFRPPTNGTKDYYIKRIIGTPGDEVSFKDNNVYVNGKRLVEPYTKCINLSTTTNVIDKQRGVCSYTKLEGKSYRVPPEHYFVMGDNRNHSSDSRYCFNGGLSQQCIDSQSNNHFVPIDNIVGKAWFVFWPFSSAAAQNPHSSIFEKFWPINNPRTIVSYQYNNE